VPSGGDTFEDMYLPVSPSAFAGIGVAPYYYA
jgi:hypothetical protein